MLESLALSYSAMFHKDVDMCPCIVKLSFLCAPCFILLYTCSKVDLEARESGDFLTFPYLLMNTHAPLLYRVYILRDLEDRSIVKHLSVILELSAVFIGCLHLRQEEMGHEIPCIL